MKEEVPPLVAEAHVKNVEAAAQGEKFDGTAGLATSGIATDDKGFYKLKMAKSLLTKLFNFPARIFR